MSEVPSTSRVQIKSGFGVCQPVATRCWDRIVEAASCPFSFIAIATAVCTALLCAQDLLSQELRFLCCRGDSLPALTDAIQAALGTLPDSDQPAVASAYLALQECRFKMHSNLNAVAGVFLSLGGLVEPLRVSCLSAFISLITHETLLEHLAGTRPLNDWTPLEQVTAGLLSGVDTADTP